MSGEVVTRYVGDDVVLTLHRPERFNALDTAMRDQLLLALEAAREGRRGVAIVGEGRGFCAGGDLDEFGQIRDPLAGLMIRCARSLPSALMAVTPRLVAGVHGFCVGAGCEMAAFANVVIAADDARFRMPELALRLFPGQGGSVSIARRIGRQRLLAWLLDGDEIDASRALDWGLVDEVVPRNQLLARVEHRLAELAPT